MDKQMENLSHDRGFPGIRRDFRPQGRTQIRVANKLNNFIDESRTSTKNIKSDLQMQRKDTQSILKQFKRHNIMYNSMFYYISEQEKINKSLQKRLYNIESKNLMLLEMINKYYNLNINSDNFKLDDITDEYYDETGLYKKSTMINKDSTPSEIKFNHIEGDEAMVDNQNKMNNKTEFNNKGSNNDHIKTPQRLMVDARILDILELQYNLDTYNLRQDSRIEFINSKEDNTKKPKDEKTIVKQQEEDNIAQDEKENKNKKMKDLNKTQTPEKTVEKFKKSDDKKQGQNELSNKHQTSNIKKSKVKQNLNYGVKNKEIGAIARQFLNKQNPKQNTTSIRPKKTTTTKNKKINKIKINSSFIELLETEYNIDTSKIKKNRLIDIVSNVDESSENKVIESPKKVNDLNMKNKVDLQNKTVHKESSKISDTFKKSKESRESEDTCCNLFTKGDRIEVRYPHGEWNTGIFLEIVNNRLIWRNTSQSVSNRLECTNCDFISIRKLN